MKKNFYIKSALFILVWLNTFIHAYNIDDYRNALASFVSMPSNINQGVDWVEPYDRTYLPFDRCGEVKDIEVTKLEESVISYMERKSWWCSLEHYRRLVSVIKVTYRVTCENKLKYEGIT